MNTKSFLQYPTCFSLLLVLCFSQQLQSQTLHGSLSLSGIAPNMYVQLQAAKTDTSFSLKQRLLPGSAWPLFFTEDVTVKAGEVSGRVVVYNNYRYTFSGFARPDSVHLQLTDENGKPAGLLRASAVPPTTRTDYKLAAAQIVDTIEQYIFNKAYLDSSGWKRFAATVKQYGVFLQDDLEFIGAVNREMRKLPFTHTYFTKSDYESFLQMVNQQFNGVRPVEYKALNKKTAYLKITSFNGDGSNISSEMERIIKAGTPNLVIDLRGNSGGGAGAALQLTKYLSPVFVPAGALVTNRWFDTASRVPVLADYSRFYTFSNGSTLQLIESMKNNAGVVLAVEPSSKQYMGKIYLLTDNSTASTCEPLVYALKQRGRATIVGERTAGAMLSAGGFWLNTGFVLSLPVADYFTTDGVRLDKVGVEPNVNVPSADALQKAHDIIAGSEANGR